MRKNDKMFLCTIMIIVLGLLFRYGDISIFGSEISTGIYERPFRDYVVFYPQHQDDEVLWGGSAIRKAIHERGADNVFVVLVSDGTGVNVFNNEKYKNMTKDEKIELRNNEFRAALKSLGIKEENTIILGYIDKDPKGRFELMEKVAIEMENKYKSVTHIAHSYKYDDHSLHRKNGEVIYELYEKGKIKDAMFFLKPKYIDKVPSQMKVIYDATTTEDYDAVKNACMEYKVIDSNKGRDGIGYTSAHNYFKALLNDKKLTSILHLPY